MFGAPFDEGVAAAVGVARDRLDQATNRAGRALHISPVGIMAPLMRLLGHRNKCRRTGRHAVTPDA